MNWLGGFFIAVGLIVIAFAVSPGVGVAALILALAVPFLPR